MYVRWWMCIRASEERVSCAANTTFSPQKTADILSYSQRQRPNKKGTMHTFISFKEKRIQDPALVIGRSPLLVPEIGC